MPKKETKITLRLSNVQLDNLKNEAKELNISLSEHIRRLTIKSYYEDIVKKQFYDDVVFQINKMGNNLNQIAYNSNISNKIDIFSIKVLVSIEKALNDILLAIKRC